MENKETDNNVLRTFSTGATRDTAADKLDFEGFLSPQVLEVFAKYMHKHRLQPDGNLRSADNWQKGIPQEAYMKSAWRHFFDWWKIYRGLPAVDNKGNPVTLEDATCALMFNVMGYLFEALKTAKPAEKKPLFPRFFYQPVGGASPDACASLFLILGEESGARWLVREDGRWTCCNWTLDEMGPARWISFPAPIEVSPEAAKAIAPKAFSTPVPRGHACFREVEETND